MEMKDRDTAATPQMRHHAPEKDEFDPESDEYNNRPGLVESDDTEK